MPTPVTFVPSRRPDSALLAAQSNISAPISSASRACTLVRRVSRGPNATSGPGALIIRICRRSMSSSRAALSRIGSSMEMICAPPGPRWAALGGVFVYIEAARKRMFSGPYTRWAIMPAVPLSPLPYAPPSSTRRRSIAVQFPSFVKPIRTQPWKPGRARP